MKLPSGADYSVAPWDPSAAEAFVTNADMDWGAERLLFRYIQHHSGTFVDVGAHTGYYSLYMAPAAENVVAIEPDSKSFMMLRSNLKPVSTAVLLNFAASNYSGQCGLRNAGRGYSFIDRSDGVSESTSVLRIDDLDKLNLRPISAIKIDVDGTDLDVLEGCENTIAKDQPIILIEVSSREHKRLFQICERLDYFVSGFVRLSAKRVHYRSLNIDEIESAWYKMLLLAPIAKKAELDSIVNGGIGAA